MDLIETFEIPCLTSGIYNQKIDGLLKRFPRFRERYRIVLPLKYPKKADDYVSMKFCVMGRLPVYGIYNKRDLQLIDVRVETTLYAVDDCDLDPDLTFSRVNLGIRRSSLAVSQSLSYTKYTISSAVSTLSLGYTLENKDQWTDAFVLLRGITTQAVRFRAMLSHVQSGFYLPPDAPPHVPHPICLSILPRWRHVSRAVREGKIPYYYNYYDVDDDKILCSYSYADSVQLIHDGDTTHGMKFNGFSAQMDGSITESNCENIPAQAPPALGASQKVSPSMKDMCFDQSRMSKEEKDPNMVKGKQEPTEPLQLSCEPKSEPIGATCVYPLQGIMKRKRMEDQQSNTNAPHSFMSNVIRRTLGHDGFKRLQEGPFPEFA